jgi:hypothetical protein
MAKIAFIVEGDVDAEILGGLVPRLVPRQTKLHFVRMGGIAGIYSSAPTVELLRSKGYDRVFIIFDADSTDERTIGSKTARLRAMFQEHGIDEGVTVIPAVPSTEAWLLADTTSPRNGVSSDAKAALASGRQRNHGSLQRLARAVDIKHLKRRNASFSALADALENLESAATMRD